MRMEYWWNDSWQGTRKYSEKKFSCCQFSHCSRVAVKYLYLHNSHSGSSSLAFPELQKLPSRRNWIWHSHCQLFPALPTRRIDNISLMHCSALFPRDLASRIPAEFHSCVINYCKMFCSPAVSTQFSCRRDHLFGVRHGVFGARVPKLRLDASRSPAHRGRTNVCTCYISCVTVMACGSNVCFRASETKDEEGPSGFRVVGRPATECVYSDVPLQHHQLRTSHEGLPNETAFPGGRAIRFPVCIMYSYNLQ